ncbi:MAG TPA: tetratricopeptide repeat protein [Gemmatimonadales bacterium]
MSKLEKLKEKAKSLEAKDPKGAIESWVQVLSEQDAEGEANPDLSIYNRIGDLYLKIKDPAQGADYYDRAVDKYAEQGLHNNAIAMCNKVLRNAPGRQNTYLKLAKLYAAKGFMTEAKQNFVEYAERMQRAGNIQHAFAALKEFADISPESDHLREMLVEHLQMYGSDAGGRRSSAVTSRPSAAAPAPPAEKAGGARRKTSSLVFLDLDAPASPKEPAKAAGAAAKPAAAPAKPAPKPPPPPEPEPEVEAPSLLEEPVAEPDSGLQIESTSLAGDEGGPGSGSLLEGLETTSAAFDDAGVEATPSIRDEVTETDAEPLMDLEPTATDEGELEIADADLELEEPEPPPPPKARPVAPKAAPPKPPQPKPPVAPAAPKAPLPRVGSPKPPPKAPAAPVAPPPQKRKTVVEIPPLELEPDFEAATTEASHEIDDEPLTIEEEVTHPDWVQTEDDTSVGGRKSGFIDLGLEGITQQPDASGSLVFANIEGPSDAPTIEDLEGRVADNPDDPGAHQALGEALIEAGERDRGIEELDLATGGFETAGELQQAQDLVDEILRLDPNSVRHRQKQVEFAFKSGDKAKLIDAYLELADTLLRSDLPEKARAVYERVAEHDPKSERAKSALAMLAPAEPPADGKVKAKDAKMTVRNESADNGDFVDLGAMMLEDEEPAKDTRMKVEDEEPTGDEEQDFQDMLSRFKQGIDENIDETDFQSHYDLGVAFKEMGLLDEAISEFQKALRAPDGKLRTSEALGICFYEKGAFGVAESILRRGLELPASGDQERLGVLYWLARALEEQGNKAEAKELYGRVFAVEIRFMDVGERVKALAKAR